MPYNLWLVSFRSPFDIIDENPTFLICELFFLTWALLLLGHGKKPQCTYAYDSLCTFRVSLPPSLLPSLFIFSNSLHLSFPSYSFTLHFFYPIISSIFFFLFLILLFIFCCCSLLTAHLFLSQAISHGRRYVQVWIAALIHGLVTECLSYVMPEIDSFWQGHSMIIFFKQRLPLHIMFFCEFIRVWYHDAKFDM